MKERLLNNFVTKLLSVVLAILLWLLVVNVDDPYIVKPFIDIPVEIINEDALTSENKAWNIVEGDKVTVTIKAKRSVIGALTKNDIKAVADLSKLSITDAVPIDVTITKYADQIEEISLGRINTVKVNIEDVATEQFPVNIVLAGEVGNGYAIGSKTATPNIVEVTGAKSLVRKVKEVRVAVNVQGITNSQKINLEPSFYNYDGDKLDGSKLKCNVNRIRVSIDLLKTKKVNVTVKTVGEPKADYGVASVNFEPKTILVAGKKRSLENLEEIVIDDILIEGKHGDVEENLDITKYLPEGIMLAQESPDVSVTVKIEPLIEKEISFVSDAIGVENLNSSLDIRYVNPNDILTVVVKGLKADVNSITVEELKPTINLEGVLKGKHTVRIAFASLDNVQFLNRVKTKIELKPLGSTGDTTAESTIDDDTQQGTTHAETTTEATTETTTDEGTQ